MTVRFVDYQKLALLTVNESVDRLLMSALGLAGEVGEYVELIKKFKYHCRSLDNDKAIEELGDILWYLAIAAETLGTSLEVISDRNIEKLKKRYPDGFKYQA
jgi:NTP pyrophosphatase (non-canonical NTP hydrolase)